MIIEKVELQNFRNHLNKTVTFTNGINLLYGKNGSGKTSILEAIGLTLFGSELRNKNSMNEAVSEGQKTAKIKVQFLADDGLRYLVEKTLPSGMSKLSQMDNKNFVFTGKSEILEKLRELLGIKLNSDKFFSNIIVASQNKITDIFSETAGERRKIFDGLFNTEIYRHISEGYLKNSADLYKLEYEKKNELIIDLKSKLLDSDELESEKSVYTEKNKILLSEINEINANLEICGIQLIELRNNKIQIESTKKLIESNELRKIDILSGIDKQKSDLQNSLNSRKIIENSKTGYEKYLELSAKLSEIEKQISKLEKTRKQIQTLKDKFAENNNELTKQITTLESSKNRISEYKKELEILNKSLSEAKSEKEILENSYNSKFEEYNYLKHISTLWESNETETQRITGYINELKIEIRSLTSSLTDVDFTEQKKAEISEKIKIYEEKKINRNEFNKILFGLNERLKSNSEAHNKLKDGICPFLTEDCLNVKQGSGIASYFRNKEYEINSEINSANMKLSEFENLDNEEKILRNEYSLAEQALISNTQNQSKIKILEDKILLENAGLENNRLKLSLMLSENKQFLENHFPDGHNFSLELLNKKINSLKSESEISHTLFREKSNTSNKITNEIQTKEKSLNDLSVVINTVQNKISSLEKNGNEISININLLESETNSYFEVKQLQESIKSEIESLSPIYKDYIQNLKSSEKVEQIELNIENDTVNLNKIIEDIVNLQEKFEILQKLYTENLFITKSNEEFQLKEKLNLKTIENAGITTEIKLIDEKIERNKSNITQISNLNNLCVKLEQKRSLTNQLRENLKFMGQMIANKLLVIIQTVATENFRLISGRTESIMWKSDLNSNDAYQVSIKTISGSNRNFELLSGGEQMMVAISLRAAMNSLLTNSKFAIFDEPTVNLDTEKRKALSESLNLILKSLDQAIIVTHDDTFMEMAMNIIELS